MPDTARPIARRGRVSTRVEDARLERVRFATGRVAVGELRGPTQSCYFRGEHATSNFIVAFPRTTLWIRQDRGSAFVADPTIATIYNSGQVYSRAPISPQGDLVDWFAISEPLVREAVGAFDSGAAESASPLPFVRAHVSRELYREQRSVFLATGDPSASPGSLEERVIGIFGDVIAAAFGERRSTAQERRERLELVERARAVIGDTHEENLGVAELALRCETSTFHLCRTFRRHTGQTLHSFRRDLRLRIALGRLPECRGDLSRLAVDLGFFSHSHFTAAFRRHFGVSPSEWASFGEHVAQAG